MFRTAKHFILWHQNPNLVKIDVALNTTTRIKSGDIFAHVVIAELLAYVQNCDVIGSLEIKLVWKQFLKKFNYELINSLWNGSQNTTML